MSQESVELVTLPSIPDQAQPLLQEADRLGHMTESAIVLPTDPEGIPTDPEGIPTDPEGFSKYQKQFRRLARRWISRTSVRMFIALIIVGVLSFCPALLSNSGPADKMDYSGLKSNTLGPDVTDGMYMTGTIFGFGWSGTQKLSVLWYTLRSPLFPPEDVPSNDTHTWNAAYIYINKVSDPVFYYAPVNTTYYDPQGGEDSGTYIPPFNTELDVLYSDQYYFPEDECDFGAMIFVLDKATNNSVPIIHLSVESSGPGDYSTESTFSNVSLKIVNDAGSSPTAEWVQAFYIDVNIIRSLRARAITYSMFMINWILTFCSIITTSVMFNRRGEVKDSVALVPITVILTIPAIRSLYVGSPPYGVYLDVVGFFPQMLTVVACTVVVLSGFAIKSRRGGSISHENEDV
ncbi:hypothetical protein BJ322DRAFT_826777 [Thelephora terrestris]|uniref:Transmembrane protein n=1 Tax=Thelephora terrestris TaxID=56493 RepID=A0A9P6HF12_9AGAM|nr:hypothetical protein BJ322DRAFT_826777 [Thelephora terrestris]